MSPIYLEHVARIRRQHLDDELKRVYIKRMPDVEKKRVAKLLSKKIAEKHNEPPQRHSRCCQVTCC